MFSDANLKSVTIKFSFSENSQLPADIWQSSENPDILGSLMTWSQSHWWSASRRRERWKCREGRALQKHGANALIVRNIQSLIDKESKQRSQGFPQTDKYKTYWKCWSLKIVSINQKIRGVILRAKWEKPQSNSNLTCTLYKI